MPTLDKKYRTIHDLIAANRRSPFHVADVLPIIIAAAADRHLSSSFERQQLQLQLLFNNRNGSGINNNNIGFYSPLDAHTIVENAKRALDAAGGGGGASSSSAFAPSMSSQQHRWMSAQHQQQQQPLNEDMLWMPQHRPFVGGGAAAAFEAFRHDYYVQKREEARHQQQQQQQLDEIERQRHLSEAAEPSRSPLVAAHSPPTPVHPRQ